MDLEGRSLPEIRELADEYYPDHRWDEIEGIDEKNRECKAFKAEVWARKAVAEDDLQENRMQYLRKLSRDEDWQVRESVAMALKYINTRAFERVEPIWRKWIEHDDNYVRRACEVGLMGVSAEHVDPALRILEHVVSDSDSYVQKSCGGFAVSHIANKDPSVGRAYLNRWSRSDNLRTRWNVAKAIGSAYGRGETDHALELAYRLSGDEEYRVRRAVAASVKNLFETNAEIRTRVNEWSDREDFQSML